MAMANTETAAAPRPDPLTQLAFSVYGSPGVYALLVGSGLSSGAGILTGWQVTLDLVRRRAVAEGEDDQPDWANWYQAEYDREPSYSEVVAELGCTQSDRRSILNSYIEPTGEDQEAGRKEPTRAHLAIADLVLDGYIRVILTTNFDRLLENALRERGVEPTVIDSVDALKGAEPFEHTKCYLFKLHGDYKDTRILNTEAELAQYPPEYDEILDRILDEHGLIVCGWSGDWDKALHSAFMRNLSRRYPLFWACRDQVSDAGQKIIVHRRGHKLPISDADDFLGKLRDAVQILARTHRQDPRDIDFLVNSTKKFLLKPEYAIELHDLLESEVPRMLHHLETSTPPVTSNSDRIQLLCEYYESAAEPLARMYGVLGRWGGGTDQDIVANAVLTLWDHKRATGADLAHLRNYPAVLLIWSYGVGLTLAKRWSALHGLLFHRVPNDHDESKRLTRLLAQWFVDGNRSGIWKRLPGFENPHTPQSDHIFKVLGNWRCSFAPSRADFEGLYDIWEFLFDLASNEIYMTERPDNNTREPWPPAGRYSSPRTSRYSIIKRIMDSDFLHDLEAAGFGERQEEHLEDIVRNYSDFINKLNFPSIRR